MLTSCACITYTVLLVWFLQLLSMRIAITCQDLQLSVRVVMVCTVSCSYSAPPPRVVLAAVVAVVVLLSCWFIAVLVVGVVLTSCRITMGVLVVNVDITGSCTASTLQQQQQLLYQQFLTSLTAY